MTTLLKRSLASLVALAAGLSLFSSANTLQADGYHYQIQVSTALLANPVGELTALKMSWVYDPSMTPLLIDEKDLVPTNKAAALKKLGHAMLEDLFEFGYFSQVSINDQPAAISKVQEYDLSLASNNGLSLSFKLPLQTALPVAGKIISLRLADPDGVGNLAYSSPQKITMDASLAKLCSVTTITEETVTLPNGHKPVVPKVQIQCK
ncbi:MAG TPA: DUF1007 family protein [Thiolinea sp.]|nr:DUF1007 family protein [Thiolinea sp.]